MYHRRPIQHNTQRILNILENRNSLPSHKWYDWREIQGHSARMNCENGANTHEQRVKHMGKTSAHQFRAANDTAARRTTQRTIRHWGSFERELNMKITRTHPTNDKRLISGQSLIKLNNRGERHKSKCVQISAELHSRTTVILHCEKIRTVWRLRVCISNFCMISRGFKTRSFEWCYSRLSNVSRLFRSKIRVSRSCQVRTACEHVSVV